jgi:outer membrane receptor protein involved in Fe transport
MRGPSRSARPAPWGGAAVCAAALLSLAFPLSAQAQRLTFLHTPPPTAQAGKELEIVGNIFGGGDLAKARCRFRQRGGAWKQTELALEYGDFYRAVIPGRDVLNPAVEYYCIGFDFFGAQSELYASASAPRRVRVSGDYRPPTESPAEPKETPKVNPEPAGPDTPPPDPSGPDKKDVTSGRGPSDRRTDPPPSESPEPDRQDPGRDDELALFGAEDVVTLATRTAQSVSDAPAMATGIPEEQMRQIGLRNLSDVLKLVPGFETSRDVQGFWRIAVRGLRDEAALLILYDGHALNSAYDSRALLHLPTENVERIEVIRGPGSSLYGAGAFLGVVNVVSKRRETVEATVAGGSFGTVDGHLSAGTRLTPELGFYGDVDFGRSDGYRKPVQRDSLSASLEKARQKAEDAPAGLTRDNSLFASAGAELRHSGGGSQSRLLARFIHQDRGPLIGVFDALGEASRLLWDVLLVDAVTEQPLGGGTLSGRLYFDHQQVDRLFQITPAKFILASGSVADVGLFEQTRFSAQTAGIEGSLALTLAQSHRLSLGLSGAFQRLPSYSYGVNFEQNEVFDELRPPAGFSPPQLLPERNRRLIGGAYAQDVWKIGSAVSVTLGARVDVTQLPRVDASNKELTVVGTRFVPSFNPRIGVVLTPFDGVSIKLLYGSAFRAPTMQEIADKTPTNDFSQGRFEGNPGLRPSTIDTVEAGLELATAVGDNRLRLRGNGFYNAFTDLISAVDRSGNIQPLSNQDKVRIVGAESELRFEVSSRTFTFINYTWFRAVDLAAPEGFQFLTDTPQFRFNWAGAVPLGRHFNLAVLVQLGAERRGNGRSQLEILRRFKIPAYALVGLQLRTEPILDALDLAITGQNVFDYDLKDDVPRPDRMPGHLPREGFGATLTARVRF